MSSYARGDVSCPETNTSFHVVYKMELMITSACLKNAAMRGLNLLIIVNVVFTSVGIPRMDGVKRIGSTVVGHN